jgi:hypothetical protein
LKLVLLHSPLVGPETWKAVAPLLRVRGHDVALPDLAPIMAEDGPYYPALAEAAASAITDPAILVAHSGAGALVPAIAALEAVKGVVFVDALLPHPGDSWFAGVPEPLGARLKGLAKEGKLPPWHAWWPKGAMERLLPDRAAGAAFLAEQVELPLAYFEEAAPEIPLSTPSAYLRLSEAYDADADAAEGAEWPVLRLNLSHLAMLTHPQPVADAIQLLAGQF